jgi:hypothetical protein
VGGAAELL